MRANARPLDLRATLTEQDDLGFPIIRTRESARQPSGDPDGRRYGLSVLGPGDPVPDVAVWTEPRRSPEPLRDVLGDGLTLLCFYLWDWSPT